MQIKGQLIDINFRLKLRSGYYTEIITTKGSFTTNKLKDKTEAKKQYNDIKSQLIGGGTK